MCLLKTHHQCSVHSDLPPAFWLTRLPESQGLLANWVFCSDVTISQKEMTPASVLKKQEVDLTCPLSWNVDDRLAPSCSCAQTSAPLSALILFLTSSQTWVGGPCQGGRTSMHSSNWEKSTPGRRLPTFLYAVVWCSLVLSTYMVFSPCFSLVSVISRQSRKSLSV